MGNPVSTLRTRLRPRNAARAVARFRRPDYLNWMKAGQGLKCCGEGLIDFCTDVINNFHRSLIMQHGNSVCPFPNNAKKITYDRRSKSWKVNCKCGVCDVWLRSIENQLATGQFCWRNTDVQEWTRHPWQLAKVFMGPGKDPTSHDPADTDTAGFLQLNLNCRLFAGLLDAKRVQSVREVRNDIFYCHNLEVTSADLTTYLGKMTDLLLEPALRNYASAQRAVDEINKIQTTCLDVNVAAVFELERSLWKEMIEEQQTTNKNDLLIIIASNKDLKKRLGDDYTKLKQDVQDVKGAVRGVRRDVQDVQGTVGDVRRDVKDVKGVVGDVRRDVQDVQGAVGDVRRDVQDVQGAVGDMRRDVQDVQGAVGDVRDRVQVLEQRPTTNKTSERELKRIRESLEKQLRTMHTDSKRHDTLNKIFVELRLQKSRLEPLPETITHRDVEELERRRQSSQVVPLSQLFSKLKGDKDVPNNVLIIGRAGVGKSTLLEKLANEWAIKKLWPDVKYVFVIKLRDLLKDGTWSLSELLLDNLQLADHDKSDAINELRLESHHVTVLIDGLDEYTDYVYTTTRAPVEDKVDLSLITSCVITGSLLPGAKVIVTTRPTSQVPLDVFGRVVDVYGFTRDGIKQYVDRFSTGNEQLRQFIWKNIDSNPNMATFCHTPIQCDFVCTTLADMFEHSERGSMPEIKTMTQLYVKATHRLGRKLHPSLKHKKTNPDLKTIFGILKAPFLKHAALAKECMTHQLKLLFYDDDLERHRFDDEDTQTGFLTGSKKPDPDDRATTLSSWSFTHLSMQEFFAATGLLLGRTNDVRILLENNKNSIKQYEIVITFICGMLGDPSNAYYLKYLGSTEVTLDFCKEFITKLKGMLENDPLKLVTLIFETQSKDLVDNVPDEIKPSKIYPMEMLALCWVLVQDTCRVTHLNLWQCMLDIQLLKQLCEALKANSTIKLLSLSLNADVFRDDDPARTLGKVVESMSQVCEIHLDLWKLTDVGLRHFVDGFTRGSQRLTSLNLSLNDDVFRDDDPARTLGTAVESMPELREINLSRCDLTDDRLRHIVDGLTRGCPRLTNLTIDDEKLTDDSVTTLWDILRRRPELEIYIDTCLFLFEDSWHHILSAKFPGRVDYNSN